jgi:hypothetical protein
MLPLVFAAGYRVGCDCDGRMAGQIEPDASTPDASTAAPPPIVFHRRPVYISSARQAYTRLSGWCGEPSGRVELSLGSITGSTLCGADAGWNVTLDLSSVPQGTSQIAGRQWSKSGVLASPYTSRDLIKSTVTCDDPVAASAVPFAGGSGTPAVPYLICTGTQLLALSGYLNASAMLRNDIVLDGGLWPGIGYLDAGVYTGIFDGLDYAIVNVANDAGVWGYGTFLSVSGIVKNVSLENLYLVGYQTVGGLVGILQPDGGVIRNCSTSGTIVTGGPSAFHLGGIAGDTWGDVIDSESSVDLPGPDGWAAGGLVGHAYGGTIQRCHATGSVVAGGTSGGGLVGRVGDWNTTCAISDSYANGAASSRDSGIAGGLVGQLIQGTVTRCYSTGIAVGAPPVGGLIGLSGDSGTVVTSSYWNLDLNGLDASAGGVGYSTSQMTDAGSYVGWDFVNVWTFDPIQSPFPVLRTLYY